MNPGGSVSGHLREAIRFLGAIPAIVVFFNEPPGFYWLSHSHRPEGQIVGALFSLAGFFIALGLWREYSETRRQRLRLGMSAFLALLLGLSLAGAFLLYAGTDPAAGATNQIVAPGLWASPLFFLGFSATTLLAWVGRLWSREPQAQGDAGIRDQRGQT